MNKKFNFCKMQMKIFNIVGNNWSFVYKKTHNWTNNQLKMSKKITIYNPKLSSFKYKRINFKFRRNNYKIKRKYYKTKRNSYKNYTKN